MTRLFQTYFNGRNAAPYDLGAGRFDGRTNWQLVNSERVTEDMGVVIREVNIEYLTWVNRDLMPTRVSNDIEFEVTVIRFDKDVMLEQTPEYAVSRYMDIRKEKLSFRSKRYGLSYNFEVDGMMTPEGQQEFAMFTKKIAIAFRMHAAFIALARLLMPDSTEQYWYSQYGQHAQNITDAQIMREVTEFGAAHKSETGVFQLIYQYAAAFQRQNTVRPDFCIFRPEKQVLFKFQNNKLNEYSRGGPSAPDRMLGAEEINNFEGISYRGFPSFPSMCYNNESEAETSMLAHDVEIGNMFVFRRSAFQNIKDFKSGVHNYIEIFSENKDGMHRLLERDLLRNWGRWDKETGNLHPYHWEVANGNHGSTQEDIDMFVYYDTQIGRHQVCTHIGDMEQKYLDDGRMLSQMVKETLAELDSTKVEQIRQAVNTLEQDPSNVDALKVFASFSAHVGRKLGGARNPVFNGARYPGATGGVLSLSLSEKSALTFLDNCFLFHPKTDGPVEDRTVGSRYQRKIDAFRAAIKKMAEDGSLKPDDLHALVLFDAEIKAVMDNGAVSRKLVGDELEGVMGMLDVVIEEGENLTEADLERIRGYTRMLPTYLDASSPKMSSARAPTGAVRVYDATADAAVDPLNPLHFHGYLPEATRATRYSGTPVGYFDDASLYSFGGSTMQKNMADVMLSFPDPVERGVALALLATPIHVDVWDTMLQHNIQIPCEYVLVRPQHHLLMSDLMLCKGGRELGETIVGYGHTGIGWKVENKSGDLHTTQWMGALVRNYAYRCIVRNVFHEESYGGGGHTFFTEQEWAQHVASDFSTPGYDRPSLLCMMVPVRSHVNEESIYLTGFGPNDGEGSRAHYHSWRFYGLRYSFSQIRNDSATVVYEGSMGRRTNLVCFQGTQRQCGNINGDPGEMIENKGHLGIERPGDRAVRKGGVKMKPYLIG
jgi:hypothetical protein